ncbi:MAG: hypothetical protein GXZ11_05315 [Tissierellia bacterium]|nr:hypothetical protein [Tissierellia bacterium]
MRLWHEVLIKKLPRSQLLGQHRECCALRGKGWGRKHSTVDYVFEYSPYMLYKYHLLVIDEMIKRGYKVTEDWLDKNYRGKSCAGYNDLMIMEVNSPIYKEHDDKYLEECIKNLEGKNLYINFQD